MPRERAGLAWLVTAIVLACASPAHAGVYTVNATSDADLRGACVEGANTLHPTGAAERCTLRGALNVIAGLTASPSNTVVFDFSGAIDAPQTPLPALTNGTFLNATACGSGVVQGLPVIPGQDSPCPGDTAPYGNGQAFSFVELDGGGAAFPGLELAGRGDIVWGVFVHGFTDGIVMGGTGNHGIAYSGIGLGAFGATPPAGDRNSANGLRVAPGSAQDVIGAPGDNPNGAGSAFSGNQGWGIRLDPGSGPTTILQEVIGGDAPGTGLPGNGAGGIDVRSSGNAIGTLECARAAGCDGPTSDYEGLYGGVVPGNAIAANAGPGIHLAAGTSGNTVVGNDIGLDEYRKRAGNAGPGIQDDGTLQRIGSSSALGANVIVANDGPGIALTGTQTTVSGNRIGTLPDGTTAAGNGGPGVLSDDSRGTDGRHTITGNTISANGSDGVVLRQAGSTLTSNAIGVDRYDQGDLGNAGAGVRVLRGPQTLGGSTGGRDVISRNAGPGIAVTGARGVRSQFENVTRNGGAGLDFPDDPTPAPELRTVSAVADRGQVTFHGSVHGAPNAVYAFALYRAPDCAGGGTGEGGSVVAAGVVSTNADGTGFLGYAGSGIFQEGDTVTATLTDADGTTSPYSACAPVVGGTRLRVDQVVTAASTPVAGGAYEVQVVATNAGPATATSVGLDETLPDGTTLAVRPAGCEPPSSTGRVHCGLEDMAPGATATRSFVLAPTRPGTATNHVAVSSDEVDLDPTTARSDLAVDVGAPTTPGPSNGTSLDEAGPVFADSLRLDQVDGQPATFTLPSGQTFPLQGFAVVPNGTTVTPGGGDEVSVTADLPDHSQTIQTELAGTRFRLTQRAADAGLVDATLTAPLGCPSQASITKAFRSEQAVPSRSLKGHAHGPWRVRGTYGSAAVRGTRWTVTDHCGRTTVSVQDGKVLASPVAGATPAARLLTTGQRVTFAPRAKAKARPKHGRKAKHAPRKAARGRR